MSWQTHLGDIVEEHGTGAATSVIVEIIEQGLFGANEDETAEHHASRTEEGEVYRKKNPHITDFRKCPRKVYFSLTGEPETEPLTTDSLINFGIGHAIEEWLAGIFEMQDLEVMREVRVELEGMNGSVTTGRADFLVGARVVLSNKVSMNMLIELKTTSSRALGFMLKNKQPGREEHRAQLNGYLHASRLGVLGKIDEHCEECEGKGQVELRHGLAPCRTCFPLFKIGFLVYVVKDPVKGEPVVHAFEVPYNRDEVMQDLEINSQIHSMALEEIDPGIPEGYKKSKYPCSYCSFKTRCHG